MYHFFPQAALERFENCNWFRLQKNSENEFTLVLNSEMSGRFVEFTVSHLLNTMGYKADLKTHRGKIRIRLYWLNSNFCKWLRVPERRALCVGISAHACASDFILTPLPCLLSAHYACRGVPTTYTLSGFKMVRMTSKAPAPISRLTS